MIKMSDDNGYTAPIRKDEEENKIVEVRSFKEGHLLDKYSPKFNTEF